MKPGRVAGIHPSSRLTSLSVSIGDRSIHVSTAGSGPAVLLLHGFPETSLMWRDIAPLLADRFTVVCADLPGYGASDIPPDGEEHEPMSKRALARDLVAMMVALGHTRFAVAGHDRGGRVAYRMALDHPERVERLAVLDVVPVDAAWELADDRLALGFWPWSLLAQDAPLPERLVGAAPEAVIDQALGPGWGTPEATFDDTTRAEYLAQLKDPARVHAICEEYRAAAGVDRSQDSADRVDRRTITCPVLALWSETGPVGQWYAARGGPLELWRDLAPRIEGHGVAGGHFFPEEHPQDTADALAGFFGDQEDPATFLRRFLDTYERRDLDTMWTFYAPNCTFPVLERFDIEPTWPNYQAFMTRFIDAFPDLHHVIERVVDDGDRVWALYTITGTHRGPLRGMEPTGRTVSYPLVAMYRIVDGRIAEADFVSDDLSMMRQLGVLDSG